MPSIARGLRGGRGRAKETNDWYRIQAFKRALLFLLFLLFPTFILCSYFFLLFSEKALLSLLFSPKMFELTKNCNFFPCSLGLLIVSKNQINLI